MATHGEATVTATSLLPEQEEALTQAVEELLGARRDAWRDSTILTALGKREVEELTSTVKQVGESVQANGKRLRALQEQLSLLRKRVREEVEREREEASPPLWRRLLGQRPLTAAHLLQERQPLWEAFLQEGKGLRTEVAVIQDVFTVYQPLLEEKLKLLTVLEAVTARVQATAATPEVARETAFRRERFQEELLVGHQALAGLQLLSLAALLTEVDAFLSQVGRWASLLGNEEAVEPVLTSLLTQFTTGRTATAGESSKNL